MSNAQTRQRPVALVTGGSRGIGAGIAIELADHGFDLVVTSIDDARETVAAIEAKGGRAMSLESDLSDLDGHDRLVSEIVAWGGDIACLVNNAGIGSPTRGDLLEVTSDAYDKVLDTNLRGTFFLTQAVARHMVQSEAQVPRSIITVSSVSADMASIERGEYCLSKAGLSMLTKLFALRLAPLGIGVFELRPGVIRTSMTEGVSAKYDRLISDGLVPMQRWGMPEDIARVVSALAGGTMAFATGSVINVDGALSVPRL
ncbi:3-ketoacyl-ACP reductase [Cupriavidus sp. CV2]|uniref:3-ketoacyl-ACP reductase n=1 Tax=Cupriavidus ulmosensis TaxID=3065913 RepID=UPI00296AF7F5|nr:3-ketoacyl-ACP reductase [Cupriavidus sp. CV2]MDW3682424.1 3-ketoacyl-ACP reductase [Cupriavidus sp. CV2]